MVETEMMKKVNFIVIFLSIFGNLLQAEDIKYLESAFEDGLYLFVEKNSKELLKKPEVQSQVGVVKSLKQLLIASLVERKAYKEALEKFVDLEGELKSEDSKLEYYRAIALFYVYTKSETPLPEGIESPHVILDRVKNSLSNDETYNANYYRAWDLYEKGQYHEATTICNSILGGLTPEDLAEKISFLYARSLFYSNPPKYDKSLDVLKELVEKYKKSEHLNLYHYWRGECYFELNKLDLSEMAFKKVLDYQPSHSTKVDVYYNLGWLYTSKGDLNEAKNYLEKIISPELVNSAKRYVSPTRYKLASILLLQESPEACLSVVAPVLEDVALKDHAALLSGRASMQLKKWDDAVKYLKIAVASTTEAVQLEAGRNLGKVYLELKQFDDSLGTLNSLIKKEVPLDFRIQVQLDLAKVYMEMNNIYQAQHIYRELLTEQSKDIDAGVHYNLANCATHSNPLIECVFERDQLSMRLKTGRISLDTYSTQKELLTTKVKGVLSRIWIMANAPTTELKKEEVINKLAEINGSDLEAMLKEIKDTYFEAKSQLPSKLGQESSLFNKLSKEFEKSFYNIEKVPDYIVAQESLLPLSKIYENLQVMQISNHLDYVIALGKQSPYLALAYHKKAKLYEKQNLLGVALENLHFSIENATDPTLKSTYLMKLTDIQINVAQKLGKEDLNQGPSKKVDASAIDAKTQKFKVKQALKNLELISRLGKINPAEIVKRQYHCYMIILDLHQAEKVLVKFLDSGEPVKDISLVENLLIDYYIKYEFNAKAAKQRLVHADRIYSLDKTEANKNRYLAAIEILKGDMNEGLKILDYLISIDAQGHWGIKAALKRVEILQKKGDVDEANIALKSLKSIEANIPNSLKLEWNMAHGRLAMVQKDYDIASKYFKQVYDLAAPKYPMKSQAMIEYAGALENLDMNLAADVYLQYYYQYPSKKNNENALLKSCHLKLKVLNTTDAKLKKDAKDQLQQLIAKLDNDKDRAQLQSAVESIY